MKANELMIGDYVQHEEGVCKVVSISIDGIFWEDEQGEGVCSLDRIKQIPLTPVILEKNGFKFDGSGLMSMMFISKPQFSNGIRFNIYVGLKKKTIEVFAAHPIEKSPNWRKSNKVYLEVCGCYVHELQHALRLCGLDMEIVL